MTISEHDSVSADTAVLVSPGSQLRLSRERLQLTLEDIANQMRLHVSILTDIEQDNFKAISRSPVFIRGYLRGYAKLVNVSGDGVIVAYDKMYGSEEDAAILMAAQSKNETVTPSSWLSTMQSLWSRRNRLMTLMTLIGVVLFLIIALIMSAVDRSSSKKSEAIIKLQQPAVGTVKQTSEITSHATLSSIEGRVPSEKVIVQKKMTQSLPLPTVSESSLPEVTSTNSSTLE